MTILAKLANQIIEFSDNSCKVSQHLCFDIWLPRLIYSLWSNPIMFSWVLEDEVSISCRFIFPTKRIVTIISKRDNHIWQWFFKRILTIWRFSRIEMFIVIKGFHTFQSWYTFDLVLTCSKGHINVWDDFSLLRGAVENCNMYILSQGAPGMETEIHDWCLLLSNVYIRGDPSQTLVIGYKEPFILHFPFHINHTSNVLYLNNFSINDQRACGRLFARPSHIQVVYSCSFLSVQFWLLNLLDNNMLKVDKIMYRHFIIFW